MKDATRQSTGMPLAGRTPLLELIKGSAFEPHPLDLGVGLAKRFAGQSVILLMTARERAATVRVRVGLDGVSHFEGTRQIGNRTKGELVSVLRAEARLCGASWVVISLGSGWQAQYANRSLRAGHRGDEVAAHLQLREDPGLFVGKPSGDCLYSAVDHPELDRAVVFSVKRREVETLADDVREAGLGLAAVRVGIASMLEAWFAQKGVAACAADLLLCDGLGVLLISMNRGDFSAPGERGVESLGAPRQCSNRPGDIAQDVMRLRRDSAGRQVCYVGPEELEPAEACPLGSSESTLVGSHRIEVSEAVFAASSLHEFHPWLERRRPALSRRVRTALFAACLTGALLWTAGAAELAIDWSNAAALEASRSAERTAKLRQESARQRLAACVVLRGKAKDHLSWLKQHPHAQLLMQRLLAGIPEGVALERLGAQVDEGGRQMSLEFHLLGGEEAQDRATRAIEQALIGLGYRIGERNAPVTAQRGTLHRWRLIIPSVFEETIS